MCCGRLGVFEGGDGGLVEAKPLLAGAQKLCLLIRHVLFFDGRWLWALVERWPELLDYGHAHQ